MCLCLLYVDRAIGQLWKQSASIIAVKGGRIEDLNIVISGHFTSVIEANRLRNCIVV